MALSQQDYDALLGLIAQGDYGTLAQVAPSKLSPEDYQRLVNVYTYNGALSPEDVAFLAPAAASTPTQTEPTAEPTSQAPATTQSTGYLSQQDFDQLLGQYNAGQITPQVLNQLRSTLGDTTYAGLEAQYNAGTLGIDDFQALVSAGQPADTRYKGLPAAPGSLGLPADPNVLTAAYGPGWTTSGANYIPAQAPINAGAGPGQVGLGPSAPNIPAQTALDMGLSSYSPDTSPNMVEFMPGGFISGSEWPIPPPPPGEPTPSAPTPSAPTGAGGGVAGIGGSTGGGFSQFGARYPSGQGFPSGGGSGGAGGRIPKARLAFYG